MSERNTIMKTRIYTIPQTEVVIMESIGCIMKTSIDLLPDMAPARRSGHGPGEAPVF